MNLSIPRKLVLLFAGLVSALAILYRLDAMPLNLWDESRQANNALEMWQSNNLAYTTYDGVADFWNTKPHLLVFLQWIGFEILGPGILGLRLPSAIAAIFTVWIWMAFFFKRKGVLAACVFPLILLCCRGFNVYHIARTGDYDALLTLFVSMAIIAMYQFVTEGNNPKFFRNAMICFSLGFLAKGVAILLWGPSLLFIFFLNKPFKQFGVIWKYILIPVFVVFLYYFVHEILTPGYLQAVWDNEILGRYLQQNEGHETHWWYYFSEVYSAYFKWFWMFIPIGFMYFLLRYKQIEKYRMFIHLLAAAIIFILVLSISQTRIHWYLAPVIPILCALVTLVTIDLWHASNMGKSILVFLLIAAWFNSKELIDANRYISGVSPEWIYRQVEIGKLKFPYHGRWLTADYAPVEKYYQTIFRNQNTPFFTTKDFHLKVNDTMYIYHMEQIDSLNKYSVCHQLSAPEKAFPVWVFAIDSLK